MDATEAPGKLIAWVEAVIPAIQSAYDYVPASKPEGLPDLVVEVARTELVRDGAERFGVWNLQQVMIDVFTCNLSIMVDNGDPQQAAADLRGYRDLLIADARSNPTLRGNVLVASPFMVADFTQPFVEYEDGTRGREMTLTIDIGDLVEATT